MAPAPVQLKEFAMLFNSLLASPLIQVVLAALLIAVMLFAYVASLRDRERQKTPFAAGVLLTIAFGLVVSIAAVPACSGGGVQEQKQIATACAGITAAVNAIAGGVEQGKVSKADGKKAHALAAPTASFCEPKPADHLSPVDYAALLNAAADLATLKKDTIR
jgi:hypothetical protein